MRRGSIMAVVLAVAVVLASGCGRKSELSQNQADSTLAANPQEPTGNMTPDKTYTEPQTSPSTGPVAPPTTRRAHHPSGGSTAPAGLSVAAGTPLHVTVEQRISSETANVGDAWSGTLTSPVMVGGEVVIPAGSTVSGTVSDAKPAVKGDRAMLDLTVTSVNVDGRSHRIRAGTEAIIAGSPRARNLGAIAGGAAAGGLIGKAVGGNKGALIGGLLGGATAGGVVAKSRGYQVELKPGTKLTFTVDEPVAIRR